MILLPPDLAERIEQAPSAELPALIGQLVEAQARAWARLQQPGPAPAPAEPLPGTRMVGIDEAAQRLGMSRSWLYRNASKLPFATRPNGHNWRFNTRGLEKYLLDRQG
jgi:Helix-turn-helix domain